MISCYICVYILYICKDVTKIRGKKEASSPYTPKHENKFISTYIRQLTITEI